MSAATDNADLLRLLTATHDATAHIASGASAQQLYRDASAVAEQVIPGPIGTAVAGVLALAAEHRRVSGLSGSLGERSPTLALAVAVLAARPATETTPESC